MRNKILTVSQLGPCGNGVPFRNPLWCLWLLANFTLATSSPFSAPGGRAHKITGPRASPSWRLSAVTFLLHLLSVYQAPKPQSPVDDPLAYQTGTLDLFFHLENDIWPGRHCVKIGHVNCKSNSHMQYALKQTLTTWSSLWFKVSKGPSPPAYFVFIPLQSQFSCCGKIGSSALGTTAMAHIKGGALPRVMTSVVNHPSF